MFRQISLMKYSAFLLSAFLVRLLVMTPQGVADVFTSSDKIVTIATQEATLLDLLQTHINSEYDNLKLLSGFLSDRSKLFYTTSLERRVGMAEHPNGAYSLIKLYTRDWQNILDTNPGLRQRTEHLKQHLPTGDDYTGALSAIVRLHHVYRLGVEDMYIGNYSGFLGPPLEPTDAYQVGRQAFIDGYLTESIEWLELACKKMLEEENKVSNKQFWSTWRSYAMSLLGRGYLYSNRTEEAKQLYLQSAMLDPNSGDVHQLGNDLNNSGNFAYRNNIRDWDNNMTELCSRDKWNRVGLIRPHHVCRYKPSLYSPYLTYKEEILSRSPYASVFYDFISDSEIEVLKGFIKGRLKRGLVGTGKNSSVASIRTSDLGWVHDHDLTTASQLSKRIKSVTWLEVDQRTPIGPSSSEAFQVVNYGLGGHYDAHMDPFDKEPDEDLLRGAGERIATFLMYLSDVEKGGHTVFLRSGISVAPQKRMALFWYNFDPTLTLDEMTHHSGCPVIVGQKWIANKWIWTYGNTFMRPCGPNATLSQLDLEKIIYTSHKT